MSRTLIYLAIFLFALPALALEPPTSDLRPRPLSLVSDPTNWLPRESRESLETFLRTRSNDFDAEVYVLLEPPPSRSRVETKAILEELGQSWSRKNWAIISYKPGQIGLPFIVSGGPFHAAIKPKLWQDDLLQLQQLSLQSWQAEADIDALARELSDSICFFSRAQDAAIEVAAQAWKKQEEEKQRALQLRKATLTTIAVIATLASLIAALLIRKIYLAKRKMYFPSTSWPQRLGAPHSGGSSVCQRFNPPEA